MTDHIAPPKDAPSDVQRVYEALRTGEPPDGLAAFERIVAHAEALERENASRYDDFVTVNRRANQLLDQNTKLRAHAEALEAALRKIDGLFDNYECDNPLCDNCAFLESVRSGIRVIARAALTGGSQPVQSSFTGPGEPERTKDEPVWCVCGAAEAVPGYERVCPGHTAQPTPSPEDAEHPYDAYIHSLPEPSEPTPSPEDA